LCESGLSRLTVSVHSTDATRYAEIYWYRTFEALRARLIRFMQLCRESSAPPIVDLAFVAMDSNLQDLSAVAAFAESLDLWNIYLFPVMRRDEIPIQFPQELTGAGVPRPAFADRMSAMVERAASEVPGVSLTTCHPAFTMGINGGNLGEVLGCGRLWNQLAPIPDEEVLTGWK
jgi:hypothetical protein